jgi:hypothetical protein
MKARAAIFGVFAGCGRGARAVAAGALLWGGVVAGASGPEPPLHISLEAIGYHGVPSVYLLGGSSMLTVNFVDRDHLLVTFSIKRLMKRDEILWPDDDDGTVGAYLLELPSGKLLAQTEWRVHDRGQYLWNLGGGQFLLRVRDTLTVFAPMKAAKLEDAFQETPFLAINRRILAILLSADRDLLTIESIDAANKAGAQGGAIIPQLEQAPVQINFYRLATEGNNLRVSSAGMVRAHAALDLPLTTAGYMDAEDGGRDRWMFNFATHAGKVTELLAWDTTCFPRTTFVSHSEFVAFGCKGAPDKLDIAGFNLRGEEMWQQNFFEPYVAAWFSFAPAAGRFALERVLLNNASDVGSALSDTQIRAQEVRVYQTYNGKLLLRVEATPIERAGQNFELSPDGLRLAVVRETVVQHPATKEDEAYTVRTAAVDVYPLPPVAGKDEQAVRDELSLAPAATDAAIRLTTRPAGSQEEEPAGAANAGASVAASAAQETPADAGNAPAAENGDAVGDVQQAGPRKPPSLYAPGEEKESKPQ